MSDSESSVSDLEEVCFDLEISYDSSETWIAEPKRSAEDEPANPEDPDILSDCVVEPYTVGRLQQDPSDWLV